MVVIQYQRLLPEANSAVCGVCGNGIATSSAENALRASSANDYWSTGCAAIPTLFGSSSESIGEGNHCDRCLANNPSKFQLSTPACDESATTFAHAAAWCNVIKDTNGPYRNCVDVLNYEMFYDACVFGICSQDSQVQLALAIFLLYNPHLDAVVRASTVGGGSEFSGSEGHASAATATATDSNTILNANA